MQQQNCTETVLTLHSGPPPLSMHLNNKIPAYPINFSFCINCQSVSTSSLSMDSQHYNHIYHSLHSLLLLLLCCKTVFKLDIIKHYITLRSTVYSTVPSPHTMCNWISHVYPSTSTGPPFVDKFVFQLARYQSLLYLQVATLDTPQPANIWSNSPSTCTAALSIDRHHNRPLFATPHCDLFE